MSVYTTMLDIYDSWHSAVGARNLPVLMRLYGTDSVFESLSVVVLEDEASGILRGRERIRSHFQRLYAAMGEPNGREWFRPGPPLTDGQTLLWEYPSRGPHGAQVDAVVSFDVDTRTDLVVRNRVYWGHVGWEMLHAARRTGGSREAAGVANDP